MALRQLHVGLSRRVDADSVEAEFRGLLRYGMEELLDGAILDAFAKDIREAQRIAYQHVFTADFARQVSERYAAAFEGALLGMRARKLIDGEQPAAKVTP